MKRKSKLTISLIILISITSCLPKYNVEVNIPEIGDDTVYVESYLLSPFGEDPILDTVYSKNGKFYYDLPVKGPSLLLITPKKAEYTRLDNSSYRPIHKSITLVLKPEEKVQISGTLDKDKLVYRVKGSELNKGYSDNRNKYSESEIEKAKNELIIDSLMFNHGSQEKIKALFRKRQELSSVAKMIQLDFIKQNLNKELAAFYLAMGQPLDTLGKYLQNLDADVRHGVFREMLDYQFSHFQKYTKVREVDLKIQPGKEAPEFELMSLDNTSYSFKSTNGKYMVLDFWGSWCGPCVAGFPKMKEYYKSYSDDLEIIGIACNDTESKWREAVEKYELGWINLINQGDDIDKDVSVMYAVKGYPTKIIINPDGTIHDIFYGEGDDFYAKIDELLGH